MSLSFPSYFPEAFLRSVVAVQAKAEREFRKALRQVPVHHFGGKGSVPDHQAYRELSAEYVRKLVCLSRTRRAKRLGPERFPSTKSRGTSMSSFGMRQYTPSTTSTFAVRGAGGSLFEMTWPQRFTSPMVM